MRKLCEVQSSSRAASDNAVTQILYGLTISSLTCSGETVVYSCCLVSEENCGTIALFDPWVSPATPCVGRSDIQTEGSNKLMEELEGVHVHPVLLHVPLV